MAKNSSKRGASSTKSKPAAKPARKPAAKPAHDYSKLFKQAVADGSTSFATSDSLMAARHGVGSHDRTSDGTQSTKHVLCLAVLKSLAGGATSVDFAALAKKFPAVKKSTIQSWIGNWRRGIAGGAFYPSSAVEAYKTVSAVEKLFSKLKTVKKS